QVGETGLEILADHIVHVDKDAHQLRDVRTAAVHCPRYIRRVALRDERELGRVVALKRPDEIQLDCDARGMRGIRTLHATLANLAVAVPFVHGALAVCGTAVGSLHRGVRASRTVTMSSS